MKFTLLCESFSLVKVNFVAELCFFCGSYFRVCIGQINYLMDEENMPARAGAIAVGGLVGLMLGARKKGRFFKKLFYTSAGAGGEYLVEASCPLHFL